MYHDFRFELDAEEKQMILEGALLNNWMQTLDSEIQVNGLIFQSADFILKKGKKHLLFLKINCDAVDECGRKVNGIVLLRGGAVACLVVFICKGERYILFVEQTRIGIGARRCAEIPAGMLDDSDDYEGVMITELLEEANIQVEPGELVDLTSEVLQIQEKGIYTSVGGMDEFLRMYVLEREVEKDVIDNLHNLHRIHEDEDEVIQIKVLPFEEARLVLGTDLKNLCGIHLYEKWKEMHA